MLRLFSIVFSVLSLLFVASPVFADQTGTLLPVSDGVYTQWTPKSGSTHYVMVDEASCNGTVDYNIETTLNQRDSYGISLSSIPNGSTITQIAITPCASKNQNGGINSTMKVFFRLNGINSADSTGYSLSGTTPVSLSTTAYSGISVVKGSSTTLEVGAVLASGNKGARLSNISAVIAYTPPAIIAPSLVTLTTTVCGGLDVPITLSWQDNSSNETGFEIQYAADEINYTTVGTVSANMTSFEDISSSCAYRVRAFNLTSVSDWAYVDIIQ